MKRIALSAVFLLTSMTTLKATQLSYAHLPLSFEPNQGQTSPEVRFLSRGAGYTLFLTDSAAVMATADGSVVRMRLAGANSAPQIEGRQELQGKVHYFRGHDVKSWRTNIPTYAHVAYREIYPGIDLLFYGNQRQLEYDFVVAPGADARAIRLAFEGADAIRLDGDGNLVLAAGAAEIVQKAPIAYQEIAGERKHIRARYRLHGKRAVAIALGQYDRSRPLVIDPVVIYSTFLGGSAYDEVRGVATDSSGNAYVTGFTDSPDFPNPLAIPHFGATFVTKIDANGQNFLYSTFIEGCAGYAIAVDTSERAYVTGSAGPLFPWTAGAFQTNFGGGIADAFAARLNSSGILDWATYLGGSQFEMAFSIAVDASNCPSVSGFTESSNDFPTKNPFQIGYAGGNNDAFVSRFDPTGSSLIWSSYLGGSGYDIGLGIAVDPAQSVYVTGDSNSKFLPNTSPSCTTNQSFDAFVAKVSPLGSLVYATCVGGSAADLGHAIAVDNDGSAYVAGKTASADFPVMNPIQAIKDGSDDAFVFKLNPAGSALIYSTYLGGYLDDYASSVAVDNDGYAYVAGVTYSRDFPVKDPAQYFGGPPWADAFLFKVNQKGTGLVYSTFLGGTDDEDNSGWGTFVAVDIQHIAHVAGNTKSQDFPLAPVMVVNPAQPAHASPGVFDGWVVRLQ